MSKDVNTYWYDSMKKEVEDFIGSVQLQHVITHNANLKQLW